MRQITKIYNVYNYNELNKEAQEKARGEVYDLLAEIKCDFLQEDLEDHLKTNYGIVPDELYYSLSYSQGDGLCFTLKNIFSYGTLKEAIAKNNDKGLNAFEKTVFELGPSKRDLILEYLNADYNINIQKTSWSYQHSNTCSFEWEFYSNDDRLKEKEINEVINELCSRTGILRDLYDKICYDLEETGYEIAYPDEEEVLEYIEGQGFEFLEDGSIFTE